MSDDDHDEWPTCPVCGEPIDYCPGGHPLTDDELDGVADPPHQGHRLSLTGAWYCDTCDSPYCDLA